MRGRWIWGLVLAAYAAVLIRLLVFKDLMFRIGHLRFRIAARGGDHNYVPFRTIWSYLRGDHRRLIGLVNLVGNIALFVPVGLMAPLLIPGLRWRGAMVLALVSGLTIEGLQAMLQVGEFDVDDVILNGLGVVIGFGVHALFARRRAV